MENQLAKNLMIQGTMSGAGKSILTAGILRVLSREGFKVAPFKSQNMALNSYVTIDGKEMGRAQVLQAAASYLEPSADMNPILLKPMGDTTSQVIVNGEPLSNMKASEYFRKKQQFIPDILSAYDRLAREADIVVIEGAGSPVEINLRENDIVNMGLAELLDAPVLIAGNIDPGGVFAQLLGTVNLLKDDERKRVKGLIINKFRGDVSLLTPGLSMFSEYCDIPFAGIVPYVKLNLDEEDSVSERLGKTGIKTSDALIHIAVLRIPYISNYTDFSALEGIDNVELYYAEKAEELKDADLIILPGTKNTIEDLKRLNSCGLSDMIKKKASEGALIIGICGGFQMLGKSVRDDDNLEGGGKAKGLGLLPIDTVFKTGKVLRQTEAVTGNLTPPFDRLSGLTVKGYEIHMGISSGKEASSPVISDGNVLGTYMHGIFDNPEFTKGIINILYEKKGKKAPNLIIENSSVKQDRELDKLADVLQEHLDWKLIHRAIGLIK